MRVTITPESRPEYAFVLGDGTHQNSPREIAGELLALDPMPGGLEGWDSPAAIRDPAVPERPRQHGTFWPEALYFGQRAVTVRGWHRASSSVSSAAFRARVAALAGEAVSVRVEDEGGDLEATGYIASPPVISRVRLHLTEFSIIVACPDPVKYGDPYSVNISGEAQVALHNDGTAPVPFVISTPGRLTRLDVSIGADRVQWRGDTTGLVLDLADGVPRDSDGVEVGRLLDADELRLPPGVTSVSVATDRTVTITVRSGWK